MIAVIGRVSGVFENDALLNVDDYLNKNPKETQAIEGLVLVREDGE